MYGRLTGQREEGGRGEVNMSEYKDDSVTSLQLPSGWYGGSEDVSQCKCLVLLVLVMKTVSLYCLMLCCSQER